MTKEIFKKQYLVDSKWSEPPKLSNSLQIFLIQHLLRPHSLKSNKLSKLSFFSQKMASTLYIFKDEKHQISLFQKKLSDFNFFYTNMIVVSRAIARWVAQPRPRPLSAAVAKNGGRGQKRRQFRRFSECFHFNNFKAKINKKLEESM